MIHLWSLITGKWRSDAESVLKAARASLERNRPELALALAQSGIARFPADAELNYVCGRVWHFRGAWDRALEHYARATDLNPGHARAWIDKGCVLHALRRSAEAREAVLRAVAREGSPADAHNKLGTLAAEAGELDEACRHFQLACAADPSFFDAYYN